METTAKAKAYEQVAASLQSRIAAGEWRPGEILPGRRALAAEYGVAAATMERAAGVLIAAGVLDASDRRGTFVTGRPATAPGVAVGLPSHGTPPGVAVPSATAGGTRRHGSATEVQATVGIIAPVIPYNTPSQRAFQWTAQVVAAFEQALEGEAGITQRFFNLVPAIGTDIQVADAVRQLLADGVNAIAVLMVGSNFGDLEALLPTLEGAGVPVVVAGLDPVSPMLPQVYVDNVVGGAMAARHLVSRGYSDLIYLQPFAADWVEARLTGIRAAIGSQRCSVFPASTDRVPARSVEGGSQTRVGHAVGRALLTRGIAPGTGVIASNDAVAMGFIDAAREQGLEPGRDYGLIGFDDWQRESHLSSLRPPLTQLGREAAGLLMRQLRGDDAPMRIALRHCLIARSSSIGTAATAAPSSQTLCDIQP